MNGFFKTNYVEWIFIAPAIMFRPVFSEFSYLSNLSFCPMAVGLNIICLHAENYSHNLQNTQYISFIYLVKFLLIIESNSAFLIGLVI